MPGTQPASIRHDLLRDERLRHGFFTRHGGTSDGIYASLNGSVGSGDDPGNVEENRALAAGALGGSAADVRGLRQIHSDIVLEAGDEPRQEGDALVGNRPGLVLTILTADCAPVLLADPEAGVVAAAHAGWRGAVAGIIPSTIAAMVRIGANPSRVKAVVGPCIQQRSYQVGQDLKDAVLAASPGAGKRFGPDPEPGRFRFDLPGHVMDQLEAAGVEAAAMQEDTYSDDRFFSHRRECHEDAPAGGRLMSMIRLNQ